MDIRDSAVYVAIAYPAVLAWGLTMLFGAGTAPVVLAVMLIIERVRVNLRRKSQLNGLTATFSRTRRSRGFCISDLRSVPAVIAVGLAAVVLLAMLTFAYYWVWVLFVASSVVCALLWLRLRMEGVRYAEVYALAAWMAPRLL